MADVVARLARLPAPVLAVVYGRATRRAFRAAMAFAGRVATWQFARDVRRAPAVNDATLRAILRRQRGTAFGRAHGFDAVLAARDPWAEYRRRVPLATYADYDADLQRMAAGERDLLTADPVLFLAPSSGTTGRPKMIPMTRASVRASLRALLLTRAVLDRCLPPGGTGRGLSLVRISDPVERVPGGIPLGDASAYGMRRAAWCVPWLYTTPLAALAIDDKPSALFVHLLFALRERELDHVSATFAHYVVQLFRTLEARGPALLGSLATGRLPADLVVAPDVRRTLEAQLCPDPALAACLRPELERGMQGIARRLWPRFSAVAAVATGTFEAYLPRLREYVGDATLCNLLYGATEAPIGINLDPARPREYVLVPRTCAVEFIPVARADDPDPPVSGLGELREGESYELVITSGAGFYRYRMDDVLRVAGFRGRAPVLEFLYRRGTILNLAAEKTTEQQVADVLRDLAGAWPGGARLRDYTVAADVEATPPRYAFYLELEGPGAPGDAAAAREAARRIDEGLAVANVDYAILRRNRAIGEPRVAFLAPGSFEALLVLGRDASPVHGDNTVKVPRLVRQPAQLALLAGRVVAGSG